MKFLSQINVNTEYTLPIVDGNNGQVLTTDGSGAVYWGSISVGAINLDGLTDVVISSPTSGQILRYGIPLGSQDPNPVWYNWTPSYLTTSSSIDALGDVTISSASVGQLLRWNGSQWVNWTPNFLTSYTETDTLDSVTSRDNETSNSIVVGGATSDYYIISPDATPTPSTGMLSWNTSDDTANLQLASGASLQLGQEQHWYVKNSTGTTIPDGTVVMAVGTDGNSGHILAGPMVADGTVEERYVLGVATGNIANGGFGHVTSFGKVRKINTSMFEEGAVLYCDPTVPGGLTDIQPVAPNLDIPIAFVISSHPTNGILAVRVLPGYHLGELHDVQIGTASTGQLLRYNSNRWENWTPNYLTTFTETDPTVPAHVKSITTTNISNWNTAYNDSIRSATFNTADGVLTLVQQDLGTVTVDLDGRYLTTFTETDPTVPSHVKSITAQQVIDWDKAYGWGNHASYGYATESYVTTAIANLVDSAPSTLDTLNELAAALGDDPNFATTVTNSIATKMPYYHGAISGDPGTAVNGVTRIYPTVNGPFGAGHFTVFTALQDSVNYGWQFTAVGNEAYFRSRDTTYGSWNRIWSGSDFTSTNVSNWNTAYNDRITAASVAGTGTKTLTLTQGDGTTLTATWVDYDTDTDAQTLTWEAGTKTLGISGGNDITLDGLATEDYVLSQGFTTFQPWNSGTGSINYTAGNVGVGTTSPGAKLHVEGTVVATGGIVSLATSYPSSANIWGISNDYPATNYGITYVEGSPDEIRIQGNYVTNHRFGMDVGNAYLAINSGNVGIGTTNPIYKFQVAGSTYVNGGTLFLDTAQYIRWGNSNQGIVGENDSHISIVSGGSTRQTIYADGRTYFPGLDLSISNVNSSHGTGTYFRGSSSHFVLGLTDGNTLYLNYGNPTGSIYSYGVLNHAGVLNVGGNAVATQTWVQSQGYLTSETDSQNLEWDSVSKNLTITNGNTVTLDGLLTNEDLAAYGYLTAEADTLATVVSRGSLTSSTINVAETTGGGYVYRTSSSWGGWARHGFSLADGSGNILGALGGYGGAGTSLSYMYLGTAYDNAWMTFNGTNNVSRVKLIVGTGGATNGGLLNVTGGSDNQVNISYNNTWGLLLGYCAESSASGYHGPNHAAIINVQNAPLHLGTNNSQRITILGNGNVGIGKTDPVYKLDVAGSLRTTGSITVDSGNQITLDQNYTVHGYLQFSAGTFGGESAFGMYGYYGIALNTRQGNGITLRGDSGNVGIGTTAPGYKLQVAGNAKLDSDVYFYNTVLNPASGFSNQRGAGFDSSTGKFEVASNTIALELSRFSTSGAVLSIRNSGSQVSTFGTDGGAYFSGNVGIGTTSPEAKLHVKGYVRSDYGDNDGITYLTGFGVEFDRGTNYLRPVTNGDKNLYIGGASAGDSNWNYVIVRANSFQYNGNEIATQSWVQSQGYLTSETDSQTLSWEAGSKNLTISNGNTVTLDGLATEEYVTSQGYITGYTETDTLNSVISRNGTTTGTAVFIQTSNTFVNTVAAANRGLTVYQDTPGADAYMTFHINSDYAGYFGLGGAENDLVWGGWSVGNARYRIWHSGNDGSGSGLDADLLDGVDSSRFVYGQAGNRRGTNLISNWNQTDFPDVAFLSAESYGTNAPTGDYTYGTQYSFHRSGAAYRTQLVTALYSDTSIYVRNSRDSDVWTSWKRLWHSGDFSSTNVSNWNTAYGWGNHADYGYWNINDADTKNVQSSSVRFVGDVEVQGTFTESSSIRFKENIKPLEPALSKVELLNPVTYNKIGVEEEEIGLIAEEVAELFPEVVTYNEEGQPQGIQYQRLSVILLKAVQELTERVNKLENK